MLFKVASTRQIRNKLAELAANDTPVLLQFPAPRFYPQPITVYCRGGIVPPVLHCEGAWQAVAPNDVSVPLIFVADIREIYQEACGPVTVVFKAT